MDRIQRIHVKKALKRPKKPLKSPFLPLKKCVFNGVYDSNWLRVRVENCCVCVLNDCPQNTSATGETVIFIIRNNKKFLKMVKHLVSFTETAFVFPQVPRNTDRDEYISGINKIKRINETRADLKHPITKFKLTDLDLPEITEKEELKGVLEDFLPDEDGIYYIYIRNKIVQSPPTKRIGKRRRRGQSRFYVKKGRPLFSRPKLKALGIPNKPRQRKFVGWNCIQKIEVLNGQIYKLFERKGRKKRKPYNKPKYELLAMIEKNKERLS